MADDGFHRVLIWSCCTGKDGWASLHVKGMTRVLRKQVEVHRKDAIMFWSEQRKTSSWSALSSMSTDGIRTCYERSKEKGDRTCWGWQSVDLNIIDYDESSVCFTRPFHKLAMMFDSTALVAYRTHAFVVNVPAEIIQWFITNVQILVRFMSICCIP